MINKNIHKEDVLKALAFIESKGVPANRHSKKFDLSCNGKLYPPKYVLSIAAKILQRKNSNLHNLMEEKKQTVIYVDLVLL